MNLREQIQEWKIEYDRAQMQFELAEHTQNTHDMIWQLERMLYARRKIKELEEAG